MSIESIDQKQAADYLGVSQSLLKKWRSEDRGPAYYRFGRRIVYLVRELDEFREAQRHEPAAA